MNHRTLSAMSVTLRVAITKKELDRLRACEAICLYHETHCKKRPSDPASDAALKTGSGCEIGPSGDSPDNELIPAIASNDHAHQLDQRNGHISEKNILIPKATTVTLVKTPPVEADKTPMPKEEIIAYLRKRFQNRGSKLLDEIKKHPLSVSYDSDGTTYINGNVMLGSNIKDLVASSFYTIKSRPVVGLQLWYEMLKEINLSHHVIKPDQNLQVPDDKEWFYIGNLT